jgi:hypothetical protein
MALTAEQKATLKTNILATPDLNTIYENGDLQALASALNTTASPDFYAWRNSVSQDEIMQNGFDWVRVDNLSVGKARIWEWLFKNATVSINPSKPNVRAGITEAWKGTAQDVAVRHVVFQHCQRKVSRVERMFATGTGTSTTDTGTGPGDMGYFGPVAFNELIGL